MRYKALCYEHINTDMNKILKYFTGEGNPKLRSYRPRGWHLFGYRCSCSQVIQEPKAIRTHEQTCGEKRYDEKVKLALDFLAEKRYTVQQQHK